MINFRPVSSFIDGRNNNYNLLRLLAAGIILYFHSFHLANGNGAHEKISQLLHINLGYLGVFIFFVTSGFLVTKSFVDRSNVLVFLTARILRIFPALFFAVLFCIIIGMYFTHLDIASYVHHDLTKSFFWGNCLLIGNKALNSVTYSLPGVFADSPSPYNVNGSLWTLPYELKLYLTVALLGVFSLLNYKSVCNLLYLAIVLWYFFAPTEFLAMNRSIQALFFAFSSGGFVYINRDIIPLNTWIFAGLFLVCLLTYNSKYYALATDATLVYSVFWFAYVPSGWVRTYNSLGDYSYGIYIYAFPIQQSIVALVPDVGLYQMILVAFPLTLIMAILSWHVIEKPALRCKGIVHKLLCNSPLMPS